ncbi:hypothetical protein K488DRAFT_86386 [Vararia minispora EC-137]|uniref:Uncharacterized protein n=1 Tax=Vararia minispora EC-137 TaxID=1314806 RepID=A0ACB8QJI9_9AGAM|nr:hypothetical protein K488DRAFT_86386 [Vararia minispora EC-137]
MDPEIALGGIFIGTVTSTFLYGIAFLQSYIYLSNVDAKRMWLRLLVLCVLLLDTLNTIFILISTYTTLVRSYGNVEIIDKVIWSQPAYNMTTIMLMTVVHMFFARRVWFVSNKSFILTAVVVLFTLVNLGDGISYVVTMHVIVYPPPAGLSILQHLASYHYSTWSEFSNSRPVSYAVVIPGLASIVIADVLIASILTFYLLRESRDISVMIEPRNTQFVYVLNQLTAIIVSTGILTAISSLATLIAFVSNHAGPVLLTISTIGSKIYANTLLAE